MSSSTTPTRICVFSGATAGASPSHVAAARSLAETMHAHNIHLVYGGGTTGLMGEVARTLVRLSGKDAVMGIIPAQLVGTERPGQEDSPTKQGTKEKKLPGSWTKRMGLIAGETGKAGPSIHEKAKLLLNAEYGQVTIVSDLQARKRLMMELVRDGGPGSGFVALSGGIGTIDELMEMISWNKHGAHNRGTCVLNVGGFWDGLLEWFDKANKEEFVREHRKQCLGSVTEAVETIGWLRGYEEGRASESEK